MACIRWCLSMCSEASGPRKGGWGWRSRDDVPQYICAFTHHVMPFLLPDIYFCTHHVLLFKRHEFKFEAQKIEQFRTVRCLFVCRTEVSRNFYTYILNIDCVTISSAWLRNDRLEGLFFAFVKIREKSTHGKRAKDILHSARRCKFCECAVFE